MNSPPVLTKGHTRVAFCGGSAPGYGGTFGYKEGEPGNSGTMGGEPSRGEEGGVPFLGGLYLAHLPSSEGGNRQNRLHLERRSPS